jgi:hypothetical protein
MKKLLLIAMISASMMACNNAADNEGDKKDSIDSALNEQKEKVDSIAEQRKDQIDTIKERKIDSLDRVDSTNR